MMKDDENTDILLHRTDQHGYFACFFFARNFVKGAQLLHAMFLLQLQLLGVRLP